MKFVVRFTALLICSAVIFSSVNAQSLEETLINLSNKAAQAYLSPASSGFGANLNTGWTTRVPKAELWGVDIQFGVVAMGAMLHDENKTFSFTGEYSFTPEQASQMAQSVANVPASVRQEITSRLTREKYQVTFSGPTVVGKKDEYLKISSGEIKININGQNILLPASDFELKEVHGALNNASILPLGAPQLTIGTIYGTQVAFRYLPAIKLDENLGESKYFGFGIQHNIGQWIPVPMPVDVSAGFFTQNLKVGDILESKATEYGLYASRTFGPGALNVTPYAGFSLQSSKMTVNYTYEYALLNAQGFEEKHSDKISFDLEGENTTKLTVGLAFKLGFLNLNVDYNVAKYSTVGAGVGFIF